MRRPAAARLLVAAAAASLALPTAAQQQQPAQAQDGAARFDMLEFVVEGDTLLGAAVIERVVYPFLGPGRGVGDADAARKALEAAYQAAGFLSVSVVLPPQTIGASGEVRLRVVAAPVERLRVVGASVTLPSRIAAAVPSLAAGNAPNFNELQQELAALARTLPDAEITPVLAAGRAPGTLAAELKVVQDRLPLHGHVGADNRQSLDTAAGRVDAAIGYDDLFQRRHAVALNWLVSPRKPSQADIVTASYSLPLGAGNEGRNDGDGARLTLALTHADTDTPTTVGGATVSRGDTWRLRWRDALAAPDGIGHGFSVGATLRHLRDRSVQGGGTVLGAPPIRYTTLAIGYDLAASGAVAGRSTTLQSEWTVSPGGPNRRNVDCFGVQREQFACKRADAEPRFQTLAFTLGHREPFGRWQLSARLSGQLADAPLVSSEQIVFGGQDSVRGYYEGEQAADAGLALRLEAAGPAWLMPLSDWLASGIGFVDAAAGKRLHARSPEVATPRLASAGFGLRVESGSGLLASLTWARVLQQTTRLVDGNVRPVSGADADRAQRWDLNVRQSF